MKIALLSAANVGHTIHWANLLVEQGCEVHVLSLHPYDSTVAQLHPSVSLHVLPWGAPKGYVLAAFVLRRFLKKIKPDVLNAHFATGYGLLARLAKVKGLPYMLSVWGTDVYEFPSTAIKRWVLKGNLKAASAIGSTSKAMAVQTRKTFDHPVMHITPFGVNTELFMPMKQKDNEQHIVIGTVKTLQPRYGIDRLLQTFAEVRNRLPTDIGDRLRLKIYGEGPEHKALLQLSETLGIDSVTQFMGRIPHSVVPGALAGLDVYVALSRYESFGVAILEANSCEIATLVSNADGPAEVVRHGETGLVAETDEQAVDYLQLLVVDEAYRETLSKNGRVHVVNNYSTQKCAKSMLDALQSLTFT